MKRPPKVADASISPQFKLNRGIYKLVKSLKEGASLEVSRGGEIVFVACNFSRLRCSFSQSTIQLLYNFRCSSSSFATMDLILPHCVPEYGAWPWLRSPTINVVSGV